MDQPAIPQFPQKLSGSLWGITTYFNPVRYKTKIENYKRFREASKRQGLKLLTAELAFGKDPFELEDADADIIIRRRSDTLLWQKERLLNIALTYLPDDCDKVAWLDGDILFYNDRWVEETKRSLELYNTVQLFTTVVRLEKDVYAIGDIGTIPRGTDNGQKKYGTAYLRAHEGYGIKDCMEDGDMGFGWAARREILMKHGFYDRLIMGSSDRVIIAGLYSDDPGFVICVADTENIKADYSVWIRAMYGDVKGSISYVDGIIGHLWHGKFANRLYVEREKLMERYAFDPKADIKLDSSGCWAWASDKRELHKAVARYFHIIRNEDEDRSNDVIVRELRRDISGWGASDSQFIIIIIRAHILHFIFSVINSVCKLLPAPAVRSIKNMMKKTGGSVDRDG